MPVIRSHAIGFSRSPENNEATHRPYSTVAKPNHTDRFSSKAMMLLSMRNPITVMRMHLFSSRPARIPSNLSPYLKWLPSLLLAPEKPQLSMPLFLALAQFPLQVTLVPRRRHSTPSTPSRFHQHQIPLYHVSLPPEPWPRHNYFQAFPIPTGLGRQRCLRKPHRIHHRLHPLAGISCTQRRRRMECLCQISCQVRIRHINPTPHLPFPVHTRLNPISCTLYLGYSIRVLGKRVLDHQAFVQRYLLPPHPVHSRREYAIT
jgi:hypothetical protein